jgi:hypothetical protein
MALHYGACAATERAEAAARAHSLGDRLWPRPGLTWCHRNWIGQGSGQLAGLLSRVGCPPAVAARRQADRVEPSTKFPTELIIVRGSWLIIATKRALWTVFLEVPRTVIICS